MTAFVFGLFAVVLQISGILSSPPFDEYGIIRRHSWLRSHPHESRNYRTFRKFKELDLGRSPYNADHFNFLFPSDWDNKGISPTTDIRSETPIGNILSPNLRTVYARPAASIINSKRYRQLFPELWPRRIVKNRNVLNSEIPDEKPKEIGESKNEKSLVLNPENNSTADESKQSTEKAIDEDLTADMLNRTTISVEMETSENTTVKEKTSENTTVEDETSENATVEDETSENTTAGDETSENTTFEVETSEITTAEEEITKNVTDFESEDNFTATEEMISTDNQPSSTHEVPENSTESMTETADISDISTLDGTTLPGDNNTTDGASMSDSDYSSPEEMQTTPSISVTDSPVTQKLSNENTVASSKGVSYTSVTSSSGFVTKTVSPIPEHVIRIQSIRTARIVISVVLLVIGIVAVVVLAIYTFRVKRRAVQYDQLTLLP